MSIFVVANNVNTTLAAPVTTGATSITLSSSANLPTLAAGQIMAITINDAATGLLYEVMYATAISGTTLTVLRAQEGTGAQAWAVGDYAFSAATAGVENSQVQQLQLQSGEYNHVTDTGAVNAYAGALTPTPSALTPGMIVALDSIVASNTSASTFDLNGFGALPIQNSLGALSGGELVASALLQLNSGGTAWNIIYSSKGISGQNIVGSSRKLAMSVTTASASATMTADEISVVSAFGKSSYKIGSFSKSINLATTGAGGMDTGTAPVSGYVAIYAIYNPTTGASALLGVNATAAAAPEVYGGANMPAGYIASALVSVWPTNASSQFIIGNQSQRNISIGRVGAFSTTSANATFTSVSISAVVPLNAKYVSGDIQNNNGLTTQTCTIAISGSSTGIGAIYVTSLLNAQIAYKVPLITPQTTFIIDTTASGTNSANITVSSYDF